MGPPRPPPAPPPPGLCTEVAEITIGLPVWAPPPPPPPPIYPVLLSMVIGPVRPIAGPPDVGATELVRSASW
ncbi:hypothetical protein DFK10_13245 [Salibaculum griseiflavum]|uniref:Uncharacterized protein n=1 Tax=Salibaculum griseiflavum TaxID=1914409 RepID=A0A2V1P4B2_9RHOB|nr:hypothetical protein DFK10_13245 [Salibaculum griseiflavum]